MLDELEASETANYLISAHSERTGQQEQFEQLRQVDAELVSMQIQQPAIRGRVARAEKERAESINELCATDFELRELVTGRVARLEDVRRFLPERTALIEYVLTDSLFAAFVVTAESEPIIPIYESSALRGVEPSVRPEEVSRRVQEFIDAIGHEVDSDGKPTYSGLPQQPDIRAIKQ